MKGGPRLAVEPRKGYLSSESNSLAISSASNATRFRRDGLQPRSDFLGRTLGTLLYLLTHPFPRLLDELVIVSGIFLIPPPPLRLRLIKLD
jgi:hypothetical protein